MFIRIKKIKGIEYAYLVKSVWENGSARQKVIQYIGRMHALEKQQQGIFTEFCGKHEKSMKKAEFKDIIQALMEWTLWQHGFVKDSLLHTKWVYSHGKIVGDSEKFQLTVGSKEVTLKINEGYMNSFTLKELQSIELDKKSEEQRHAATRLAKACVAAGILVPQNVFIEIFQKLYT